MDNQVTSIDYSSQRARQAKLAPVFGSKTLYMILLLCAGALLVGGLALVSVQLAFGWVVMGLAGPVYVLAAWGKYIRTLPPSNGTTLDAMLDVNILAKLPKQHTPKDIATTILNMPGSNFIGNRFFLSVQYVVDTASTDPQASQQVWQLAQQYRAHFGFKTINAAVLLVAIVQTTESIDDYLAHIGIEKNDLVIGLEWYKHIEDIIAAQAHDRQKGGIGRDWAFGYVPLLDRLGFNIS